MGILSAKTLKLCILLQFLKAVKLAVRKQKHVFMRQLMHLGVATGAVSGILGRGKKRRGPFKFGNDERNVELSLTWREVSCDVMSTVGTLWRRGAAYPLIWLHSYKDKCWSKWGKTISKFTGLSHSNTVFSEKFSFQSKGSPWKRGASARFKYFKYANENLGNGITNKSVYLDSGLLSMFRAECVGEQMCTHFLAHGIFLLYDFLSVRNGICHTCRLWLFEMRCSWKGREKFTAAAMNVTTAPGCQAAHIHQIHTAMPKHAFQGTAKQEKNTGWSQALSRELSSDLPGFSCWRILFCSGNLPVVPRKLLAKWKKAERLRCGPLHCCALWD